MFDVGDIFIYRNHAKILCMPLLLQAITFLPFYYAP